MKPKRNHPIRAERLWDTGKRNCEDGYALLAEAVIMQAVEDYKAMVDHRINEDNICSIKKIESFFNLQYTADIWPGADGETRVLATRERLIAYKNRATADRLNGVHKKRKSKSYNTINR